MNAYEVIGQAAVSVFVFGLQFFIVFSGFKAARDGAAGSVELGWAAAATVVAVTLTAVFYPLVWS